MNKVSKQRRKSFVSTILLTVIEIIPCSFVRWDVMCQQCFQIAVCMSNGRFRAHSYQKHHTWPHSSFSVHLGARFAGAFRGIYAQESVENKHILDLMERSALTTSTSWPIAKWPYRYWRPRFWNSDSAISCVSLATPSACVLCGWAFIFGRDYDRLPSCHRYPSSLTNVANTRDQCFMSTKALCWIVKCNTFKMPANSRRSCYENT